MQMIDDKLYDYAGSTFLDILPSGSKKQDDSLGRVCAYITNQYDCYNRKYHNCYHIVDVLDKLDEYVFEHYDCKHQNEMRVALLLHDVVYDVPCFGQMTNEMKSAAVFDKYIVKMLPGLRDNIDCHLVSDLILSTQYGTEFEATEKDELAYKLVHDIDFSSLGDSFERFCKDGKNIRQEYWMASDKEFEVGRKAFLQSMLAKPKIYLTEYYFDKYEAQARSNMQTYLDQ